MGTSIPLNPKGFLSADTGEIVVLGQVGKSTDGIAKAYAYAKAMVFFRDSQSSGHR